MVLSNGDIAISGGPYHFEIVIYRHMPKQMTKDNREKIEIVDSLDCNGCQVNHLLEVKEERYHLIIAVG